MTWQLCVAFIAALGFVGVMTWLVLPYVRRKSDYETRIAALEAANVALSDRTARIEQAFGVLPRGMGRVAAVSR